MPTYNYSIIVTASVGREPFPDIGGKKIKSVGIGMPTYN
jgi:hypothetical protein